MVVNHQARESVTADRVGGQLNGSAVLMSVYDRESASNLRRAIQSVMTQTRRADEFILVKDGPLNDGLEQVISSYQSEHPGYFKVISQPQNLGLTKALNAGLAINDKEFTFRMDSDDVADPRRFECQLNWLRSRPEVGVLGTAMREFTHDPSDATRMKPVKESHAEITAALPWRNPMNHPTVCFRTDLVKNAGGYPECQYVEDYLLWCRLLSDGVQFRNLPEPLYYYRFNEQTLERRGGWVNFRSEVEVRRYLLRNGLASLAVIILAVFAQLILRFAPVVVRKFIWRRSRENFSDNQTA